MSATAFEFFRFPFAEADTFKDRLLSQDDVPDVACEILDVRTKSDLFGRVLKLPAATVESIHQQYSNPQDRLFHIIDELVKQVEPPPTWRVILEALRNPLIGYHYLALKVERKHCPLTLQQDGIYLYRPFHHWYEAFLSVAEEHLQLRQTPQDPTTTDLESALPLSPPQSISEHGKLHLSIISRIPLKKLGGVWAIFACGLRRPGHC